MDWILVACGTISALALLVGLRENLVPRVAGLACIGAGFALASALHDKTARAAVIFATLAVAFAGLRAYDARRPNRSRTRR
jgi:hypothetical protein